MVKQLHFPGIWHVNKITQGRMSSKVSREPRLWKDIGRVRNSNPEEPPPSPSPSTSAAVPKRVAQKKRGMSVW